MPSMLVWISMLILQVANVLCQNGAASSPGVNYRVLSVSTSNSSRYLQVLPDGSYQGFIWDLMNTLKDMMGFSFTFTTQADGLYGGKDSYGNWNGMTGQLMANNVDIIAADYTITSDRSTVIDFTTPYLCYKLVIVTLPNASLENIKYALYKGSAFATYLQNSANPVAQKIWASIQVNAPASLVDGLDGGLALVRQGGWAYVTSDLSVAQTLESSKGQLVIMGPPLQGPFFYALGVRLGDKLGKSLSINLAKMVENDQMQQLLTKWGLAK